MKPIQVKATIERGDNGTYDVTMEYLSQIPFGLLGQGKNVEEAIADFYNSYNVMIANLEAAHKGSLEEISNAYNAEDRINQMRNNLRDAEIEEIDNNGKNYQTSVYYMDVVSELEKMGDFMINVSQNLERAFVQK